jgi:hypothetical protein
MDTVNNYARSAFMATLRFHCFVQPVAAFAGVTGKP